MQNLFSQILSVFFKLVLAAFGLVFATCFLLAAVAMVLFGFVKWALTGKKPAPFAAYSQFRQFRQFRQDRNRPFNPFASETSGSSRPVVPTVLQADVVDVEMRQIRVSAPFKSNPADIKP